MENNDYSAILLVDQNKTEVFEAVKNFRGWWSEEIDGETDQLNKEFYYHYKDIHLCRIKLILLIVDKKLVYQVIDNHFSFINDKREWVNTQLIFEISNEGDQTKLKFTHKGLVQEYECFKICNEAWGNFIHKSLFKLITTGKGEPNPKDAEGFNAEIVEKWKLK